MNVGIGVIVTALLFSLFTKWGFFDLYWVIAKWVGLVIMFVVIIFFLSPAVNGMAALSDVEGIQVLEHPRYWAYQNEPTLYCSILLLLLLIVIGLSVFKPWGPRKKPFATRRKTVLASSVGLAVAVVGALGFQFVQLQEYRSMPIGDVNLEKIADGVHIGVARLGFDFKVEVSVENRRIFSIRVLENSSSVYAKLAEGVMKKVLEQQALNVRAVTGATTTSKCLLKAVENAFWEKQMSREN